MKLLTKELEKKFEKYPLGSQDELEGNAKVIAKFFNPSGAGTWLITEASKEGNDWTMFGYVDLGDRKFAELGYISLNELQSMKVPPFGLGIERDLYFPDDITLSDACKEEFGYVPDYLLAEEEPDITDDF